MRVSLTVSGSLYRCAFSKAAVLMVALLATVCCGAVAPAKAAAPVAAKKKKAGTAKSSTPAALPNGHVGQEYGTRIGGVLLDAGVPQCTPVKGLPEGLDLDCATMTIHGHPQAATKEAATVSFTVSDLDKHHVVDLAFTITVLDGPDVVQWGATPVGKGKAKQPEAAGGKAALTSPADGGAGTGQHGAVAPVETRPYQNQDDVASAPESGVEPVQPRALAGARVIPAVAMTGTAERSDKSHGQEGPGAGGGGRGADVQRKSGVRIEVDPETPFVEGASTIKGRVINDTERRGELCVALRQRDGTLTEGGDRHSNAALKAVKGSPCLSVESEVKDGEFSMGLTSPIKAGFEYEFAVRSSKTDEAVPNRDAKHYVISLELPVPEIKVTSLIRDGVKTISGTCGPSPEPALATSTSATPPVVGNLPLVAVELHDPDAPGGPKKSGVGRNNDGPMEWHTAELVVGDTKSQKTVESDEATASADGCTFSVMLKTPLAAGERVRIKLKAPAHRYFIKDKMKTSEAVWPDDMGDEKEANGKVGKNDGLPVYTALALAPPVITSQLAVGTSIITGTGTPSPSNGTQVTIAAISDDDYEDRRTVSPGLQQLQDTAQKELKQKEKKDLKASKRKDSTLDLEQATVTQAMLTTENQDEAAEKLYESPAKAIEACRPPEEMTEYSGRFLPLQAGSKVAVTTTGTWSITLATPLQDGQRFHLVQVLPPNSTLTDAEKKLCQTTVSTVKGDLDWGRIHADFVAGVLISNDSANSTTGATGAGSGNFSQAHQFFALNVEKSWALPGCYLRVFAHAEPVPDKQHPGEFMKEANGNLDYARKPDQCFDWQHLELSKASWTQHFIPGFSSYFQTRLTAIPVSTVSTSGTTAGTISSTASNIISTAQTARVEVGTYLPFFITRWEYDHKPNALFFAPLAKTGFDTVTGPSTVNTITASGTTTQSQTYEQVYTFWSYGARIGHMELTKTENKAPETFSYLDIAFGPYSNLQSYICHNGAAPILTPPMTSASTCVHDYGPNFGVDSRKRLYRFDVEGLLKIPKTLLYVGLNANIGQKTLGSSHLDHGFAAPDDVRFLFGTKFDIASVLSKFKLGPQ